MTKQPLGKLKVSQVIHRSWAESPFESEHVGTCEPRRVTPNRRRPVDRSSGPVGVSHYVIRLLKTHNPDFTGAAFESFRVPFDQTRVHGFVVNSGVLDDPVQSG